MLRRSRIGRCTPIPDCSNPPAKVPPWRSKVQFEPFPQEPEPDTLVPTHLNMRILTPRYVPWMRRMASGTTHVFKWLAHYLVEAPNTIIPDRPKEEMYRFRRVVAVDGKRPVIGDNCFIAPCAAVLGNVQLARKNFIGYNAVVRADIGHKIVVGESSNIQDKAIVTGNTTIGKWVSIEPMAIVDGAEIGSNSMVGLASIVMKGAKIESGAILCAAAVLKSGETIRSGEIWAGNPAQKIGDLSEKEKEAIVKAAKHHVLLAVEHHDSWSLCWEDWENIRLARETWAIWASDTRELRVRPNYIREPPTPRDHRGKDITTPKEAGEGHIGALDVPMFDSSAPGHL